MSIPTKLIDDITLLEALASRRQREHNKIRSKSRKVCFNPVVTIIELDESSWTYWKEQGLTFRPSALDSILDF